MRKTAKMAALGICMLLALGSCDVLFMGVFPGSAGQATARADLSAVIGSADAGTFSLSIARSYGFELVILSSPAGFDPTKAHIVVLSPKLGALNTYTLADIPYFSGGSVFAHLIDGHIVIGNFDGVVSSAGLAPSPASPLPIFVNGWPIIGAVQPTMLFYTWDNFQIDSANTMSYNGYLDDWSGATLLTRVVRPIDASHGRLFLDGVFTNPEDELGNASLFVLRENNTDTDHFIQVPKSPDLEAPGTLSTDIFSSNYPTFSKSHLDPGSVAVTADSIVAYDSNARAWIRFTPSSPDTVTSLYVGRRGSHEKSAFSFSGRYYCIWDPDARTLTRYEDWW
jgi:hypothetical protein